MAEKPTTKLKLSFGPVLLEYEGTEAFLQTQVPKLVRAMDELRIARLAVEFVPLQRLLDDGQKTGSELNSQIATTKSLVDSMSETGEMESLRMQMAMDRRSKLMSTLSKLLKMQSEMASNITQNMK